MPGGTDMDIFGRCFPKRTFDVSIAEQHVVTMGPGMACEGLKPFVCIYHLHAAWIRSSSFLLEKTAITL